jgi:hypothetical protein
MAAGPITQISDVVVPEIFTGYVQQMTEEKSRIVQSGIIVRDPAIDALLAGGGLTFNTPSWQDLDNDVDRISTDTASARFTGGAADPDPQKIGTANEISVRMNRNQSWSSAQLATVLAGADPLGAISNRVADYWSRRLQAAFVATMNGVIADNVANDAGDYQNDVSGAGFIDGVTNFSAEAVIDTAVTMGDSMEALTAMIVHSVVFARMQKLNLIDFIPDSRGETNIASFLGREVIIDDGMPATGNVYDTWLFGGGMTRLGVGSPAVPTQVEDIPGAGNGGGQQVLYNRHMWTIHPTGHAYVGTPANGGPSNLATANNLAAAASWNRVYSERKQIKFARLVTREA